MDVLDTQNTFYLLGKRDGYAEMFMELRNEKTIKELAQEYLRVYGDNPHAKYFAEGKGEGK